MLWQHTTQPAAITSPGDGHVNHHLAYSNLFKTPQLVSEAFSTLTCAVLGLFQCSSSGYQSHSAGGAAECVISFRPAFSDYASCGQYLLLR